MPNWCYTNIVIEGDKKDVETLNDAMEKLENMNQPFEPNGFGKTWLGNLVVYFGGDWNKIRCRGEWMDRDFDNGCLSFNADHAWAPPIETLEFLKEKFPSFKIYWQSEEPGMCEYWTNDANHVYFHDKFYLEMCTVDDHYYHEYFEDEESLVDYVNKHLGLNISSAKDLAEVSDKWEEEYDGAYIFAHEFLVDESDKLLL